MLDRREMLALAGGLTMASAGQSLAEDGAPRARYGYLLLDLPKQPGAAGHRALASRLASAGLTALSGAEALGVFAPQLGWGAHQAALLLRLPRGAGRLGAPVGTELFRSVGVATAARFELTPTLRPADTDRPQPGGIYVHRWFTVRAETLPEFLELSSRGWKDFERRFDARIFGLFQAGRTASDTDPGVVRLLLLTRYGSHGVWEASRDPSTEAMQAFARRQQLTLDSSAASTILVPAPS